MSDVEEWTSHPHTRKLLRLAQNKRATALLELRSAAEHSEDAEVRASVERLSAAESLIAHMRGGDFTKEQEDE